MAYDPELESELLRDAILEDPYTILEHYEDARGNLGDDYS